ncbi:MAG: sucrase ferredoxin [Myxococcota bacterium]
MSDARVEGPDRSFCAIDAERAGEPLAGSAAFAETWLFVEERGPWEAKKLLASPGLAPLAEMVAEWQAALGGARLQLLRRPAATRRAEAGAARRVLVARPRARRAAWFSLRGDASDRTLPARFEAGEGTPLVGTTLFVCTHGKRDRCCSKFGVRLVAAAEKAGGEVWETSHLGGHRFAATTLRLSDGPGNGDCHGRVLPEDVPALLAGAPVLDRLRGHVGLPGPAQAAAIALRRARIEPGAFEGAEGELVRFAGGSARVRRSAPGPARLKTCFGEPEPFEALEAELLPGGGA